MFQWNYLSSISDNRFNNEKLNRNNNKKNEIFEYLDDLDKSNLEQHLRELGFGYRARYIHKAIQYLKYTINDPKYFQQLKSASVEHARSELLKIVGVGRKVFEEE